MYIAQNKGKNIYLIVSDFSDSPYFQKQFDGKMGEFDKNETNIVVVSLGKIRFKITGGDDIKGSEIKPYQQYSTTNQGSPISNFFNKGNRMSSHSSCLIINKYGKVVLTQAAELQDFGLLIRQLKIATKVIMP